MQYRFVLCATTLLALATAQHALAAESSLKAGAKKIGEETGQVVHKIGEGGKEVGKKIADVAVEVGHATRDGAKEFAKAVKGEGSTKKNDKNSAAPKQPVHQHKGY